MSKKDATFVVHPDAEEAFRQYRMGNKAAFEQAKEARWLDNKEGIPYWDTRFDWAYKRAAMRNTAKYRARGGPPFPKKKGRKKR